MLNLKRLNRNKISIVCKLEAVKPTLNKYSVWAIRSKKDFLDRARLTNINSKNNSKNKLLVKYFNI